MRPVHVAVVRGKRGKGLRGRAARLRKRQASGVRLSRAS
jgi:hypothetical protein